MNNAKINYKSKVRTIKARAELIDSASAEILKTFKSDDVIKSFTIERVGDNNKFFGFGICQKLNIKLRDLERVLNIPTSNHFKVYVDDINNSPLFFVTECHRDEKTNELSVTAYDKIYFSSNKTVSELSVFGLEGGYNLKQFADSVAEALNLKVKLINIAESAFQTNYPTGANFEGTETLRESLDDIAEATQTIYYTDGVNLIFRKLGAAKADLSITKEDYFELKSRDNRKLTTIISATELGDNVSATTGEMGTTQVVRDNPFWELREDISTLLNSAIENIGNFTIAQFECNWRGNPLLEIGDKIEITSKDNNTFFSYILDDTIEYNGMLTENTRWSYDKQEEGLDSNPTNLGDVLKQTFAKVDKANKKIDLVASETSANKAAISQLSIKTDGIDSSVKETIKKADTAIDSANKAVTEANKASQSVDDKISNLKVGGRNLLLNTGVEHKNAEYRVAYYTPSRILEVGETLTISVCVTPADKCNLLLIYNSSGMGDLTEINVTPNQKQVVSATLKVSYWGENTPDKDIAHNDIAIYRRPNDGTVTGETTIHWVKLETGTIATDWLQAPEDVEEGIESNSVALQNTKEQLERLEQSQEASDAALTEIEKEVRTKMTSEEMRIEINKAMSNGVDKVQTSTGFSFNEDGLDISKTGSEMTTKITEDGMQIHKSGQKVLTANNTGVDATNLHATTWLIIGDNSRIEDYGTERSGIFWIG